MNIPMRMVSGAGKASALGIATASAVHVAWALGSTWPRRSPDDLADLVVGRRPFPSAAACWAVAGLLGAGAVSVGIAARGGPSTLARAGTSATALAMLARGVAGIAVSSTGAVAATDEFRRHDLRVYSPLCLLLGAGAVAALRSGGVSAPRSS